MQSRTVIAWRRRRPFPPTWKAFLKNHDVTRNPTAAWTAQQVVEALPWELPAKYLLRDRDKIYGDTLQKRVRNMRLEELLIAPRRPWQNPIVTRMVGSISRAGLDHLVVLNERHLRREVSKHLAYNQHSRTHLALEMDCPEHREIQEVGRGRVVESSEVGGLHPRHERRAA